jgi:dihydrofolate reductase
MSSPGPGRPSGIGELTITMFLTLDGVLQGPGGVEEDRDMGFEQGGWQAPFFDEGSGARVFETYERADALLLGRRTYDIWARYWPVGPADSPFTKLINELPRYVASRTLTDPAWAGTTVLDGDAADTVAQLKEQHERIIVPGSGGLIQTLLRHALVDRLDFYLYPVALGSGKRLFGEGTVPAAFRLEGSEAFEGGAVGLRYAYAGEPTYADIG